MSVEPKYDRKLKCIKYAICQEYSIDFEYLNFDMIKSKIYSNKNSKIFGINTKGTNSDITIFCK